MQKQRNRFKNLIYFDPMLNQETESKHWKKFSQQITQTLIKIISQTKLIFIKFIVSKIEEIYINLWKTFFNDTLMITLMITLEGPEFEALCGQKYLFVCLFVCLFLCLARERSRAFAGSGLSECHFLVYNFT